MPARPSGDDVAILGSVRARADDYSRAMGNGGGPVRPAVKWAARQVGVATASIRPLPDFLVIGTKRGGTTSLYLDLVRHPGVLRLSPPPVPVFKSIPTKGVRYFDQNYARGERWYRSFMPTVAARAIAGRRLGLTPVVGEASPMYLFHPLAAERAAALVPRAKIIVMLRDPAVRAYSHWKERRRSGIEPLDFEAALDAEAERLEGELERILSDDAYVSVPWEHQTYAAQGRYAASLQRWLAHYDRDQMLVLASEDYYADPVSVLRQIDEFLGLPPREGSSGEVLNAAPGPPLSPEVRQRLARQYADEADALAKLTGRSFPWVSAR